jgi:alpha-beta hydrolase superfamily lysophospholipase
MLKKLFLFVIKQAVILVVAVIVALLVVRIRQEKSPPFLKVWHTTILANEFKATSSGVRDFDGYLKLEDKLFRELKERVEDRIEPEDRTLLNRYFPGSLSNPQSQPRNWDRSYVSIPPQPKGAVVLIHGLTDSPYSMHGLAELFMQKGYAVFVPRMPGHGTIPRGLVDATWQDWVAATQLACEAARQSAPGKPLIVSGYSNGGLLAVKFTLDEIDKGKGGKPPEKLILMAPAIGITEFAVVTGWYRVLAQFPYFKKVPWLSIVPEYDPFKYNSFPKMASDQIFRLTKIVNKQLEALQARDGFGAFPPTLTFTSVVDSTVLTPELVSRFYSKMQPNGSELVLYDVNRSDAFGSFIPEKHDRFLHQLTDAATPFTLTLITNQTPGTLDVVARRRVSLSTAWKAQPLLVKWPRGVYSLSHLAIPNSPEDPLYGDRPDLREKGRLVLGLLQPRGETGVLDVPASQFLRLRFNPFFEHLKTKVSQFVEVSH